MSNFVLTASAAGSDGEWETICSFDHDPNDDEIRAAIRDHVISISQPEDVKDADYIESEIDSYFDPYNGGAVSVDKIRTRYGK